MKHIHAELMMQYAQDAIETDKPWERWEWHNGYHWLPFKESEHHPSWDKDNQYRRKPSGKAVVIDGQEFIVPKSFKPKVGDFYFCFSIVLANVEQYKCQDRLSDWEKARSGICYRTEEEAEQALKFWQKINEA